MYNSNKSFIEFTPFGGANTVTGSCYLITVTLPKCKKHYLVDCGLFTEKDGEKFNTNISAIANSIDAVFITHAHVDHIGRLPYLYRLGYRGPIYATSPVKALSRILLTDSAKIQEQEYQQFLRKAKLKNKQFIEEIDLGPLYTVYDAECVMEKYVAVDKGKNIKIDECAEVCYYNAGHALGSSSIMLTLSNGTESFKIYFSGDIGQNNPILKRRQDSLKKDVDFVVMESTYAGRYHREREESWSELRELVAKTIKNGGNVIFPAFAVGRTQELLYLYYKDMMENHDEISEVFRHTKVYVDSNMAVQATREFMNFPEEFKEAAKKLVMDYQGPFNFANLTMVADSEASKELTINNNNYIVFSAAGMCSAGRVIYHLEKDLPNPKSSIIFTGYQAIGTLGRQIIDGATQVKILGNDVNVKARIAGINAFSAHVDQNGLIKWLSKIEPGYVLFLGHGEPENQVKFKDSVVGSGLLSKKNVEILTVGNSYMLYKGGFDVVRSGEALPQKVVRLNEDMKITEIKRIRDFVSNTPTSCLDAETIKLLKALENRLTRVITRDKKAKRTQSKPNKRNTGRKK